MDGVRVRPWADTLLSRILKPAAKRAGIIKRVGWHTFRHTYSTLLQASANDVKVAQELMRHANVTTTMNIYTQAISDKKREAQSPGGGRIVREDKCEGQKIED